jgi:hypothetical protein
VKRKKNFKGNLLAVSPTAKRAIVFGGGVLTDGITGIQNKLTPKVTANGIFTIFQAWDFPCYRQCIGIVTVFHMPTNYTKIKVYLKRTNKTDQSLILHFNAKSDEDNGAAVLPLPLNLQFRAKGEYEIVISGPNKTAKSIIPFEVRLLPWPTYTEQEKEFCRQNPNIIRPSRANIECRKCHHIYIFEEYILNDQPLSGGIYKFPDNGIFKCEECGRKMNLRDLNGQLRAALKEQIAIVIAGKI